MKTFKGKSYYTDDRGWLAVRLKDLEWLDIEDKISSESKQTKTGKTVYLKMNDEKRKWACVGFDPNGVKRVWGVGKSRVEARLRCHTGIQEYVHNRPDTGPVTNWTTEYEEGTKNHSDYKTFIDALQFNGYELEEQTGSKSQAQEIERKHPPYKY